MIQVVVDDSNRGQEDAPAFILAGWLATADSWGGFTEEWLIELKKSPSISLLKASEAINLKKNFAGWTQDERNDRLLSFVKIIRDHVFAGVHTSLKKQDFDRILREPGGALKKLYVEASISLITRVMHFAEARKMRQEFEYIFDENILTPNQLRDLHREAIERMPQKTRFMKKFRHDTDDNFFPLQAADLFAGYYREKLVAESEGRNFQSPVLDALMRIPRIDATVTERHMNYIARRVQDWRAGRRR